MIECFCAAWLPGSEGDAVADVLYGDYEFKGKLSLHGHRVKTTSNPVIEAVYSPAVLGLR